MEKAGHKVLDEYVFCSSCWDTLADKQTGPSYMRGLFAVRLRELGVVNADDLANRYMTRLTKAIPKDKPS